MNDKALDENSGKLHSPIIVDCSSWDADIPAEQWSLGHLVAATLSHPFQTKPLSASIVNEVRSRYAAVAQSNLSTAHAGVRTIAEAFGYTPEELALLPAEANMGLSCGNPTATANLKPGEIVVDL